MERIKLIVLYQVIMHYRAPLYERLSNDNRFNFILYYGKGKAGTKLINTDLSKYTFKRERVPEFRLNIGANSFPVWLSLFFKLINESPDVVFSEGSSSLVNSTIGFVYSKLFGKKFIWWSLGQLDDKEYKGFRKLINKWELFIEKHSDGIFTYSTQGLRYFKKRNINPENIFVGVNVLDTHAKLAEVKKYADSPRICSSELFNIAFIGTLTKEKKLDVVIEVINELNHGQKRFCLHIIGDGSYKKNLENYIQNREFDNNSVIFHGRINEGSSRILKDCQLMVLPGLGGLAICDGMINSLPIITGKADGTELDLVDSSNGYILPDLNREILKEKILYLYDNPEQRELMAKESFRKITEVYTFDNYYEKFVEVISSSLKNNK